MVIMPLLKVITHPMSVFFQGDLINGVAKKNLYIYKFLFFAFKLLTVILFLIPPETTRLKDLANWGCQIGATEKVLLFGNRGCSQQQQ